MRVTIQQIADKAGVSRGTVDRALNNRGRIAPEVAEKIRNIAEELGYTPTIRKKVEIKKNRYYQSACKVFIYVGSNQRNTTGKRGISRMGN